MALADNPGHGKPPGRPGPASPANMASSAALPTYALYGEVGRTQATEALHCERIAERSQRHDWEIAPHRHASLFQILHIQQGSAQAWLDTRSQRLDGPGVLLVPALVPHGFVFSPGTQGTVITVLDQHLARLLQAAPALAARLASLCWLGWADAGHAAQHGASQTMPGHGMPGHNSPGAAAEVDAAVARLQAAFAHSGAWRDLALDAALLQLAVVLGRLVLADGMAGPGLVGGTRAGGARPGQPSTQPSRHPASHPSSPSPGDARALAHVQRYRALVDAQFRQQPALTALARPLGITPTQLNRVCHRVLGHSALAVLHGRLVLEAQRDLAYTTLSVKQIGGGLGFADASYFTRFFQRQTGHTPSAWRALRVR